ncbi:MAG: glycogen synthase [Deltaproteobacteria bacterium]
MKVLFVASECTPYAKAGGLGDVVGALPKALHALGVDVRVVLPKYAHIDVSGYQRHLAPLGVPLGDGTAWCALHESRLPGTNVPVYFLEHDALFGGAIYESYGGTVHEAARFGLLSRGAFSLCRYLGFVPDVFHVHDWPSAWLPIMHNTVEAKYPFFDAATVFTIHNMAHQPRFPKEALATLRIPESQFKPDGLEDFGQLNPFKGGAYHATMITTVSPRYAWEIRTPEGGAGLHEVMEFRGADLVGILNGIDEEVWNPEKDPYLAAHYAAEDLSGKAVCKRALQRELGLDVGATTPLIGIVSRLNHQKGSDVIATTLDAILAMGAQVVLLGSGDPTYEAVFAAKSEELRGRFAARIGFDEGLSHRIEAGADLFLMPSRFEPCGLNQMYSQRYGTLPIVTATGGLDDTVEQCDPATARGTGFKLSYLSSSTLLHTIDWALSVYRDAPLVFRTMQERCMEKPMGWEPAAIRYRELYQWALERRRPAFRAS